MEEESIDLISTLPEFILQHILSFLTYKEVTQASVVSKTWQKAWQTFPNLEFDHTFFERTDLPVFDLPRTSAREIVEAMENVFSEKQVQMRKKKRLKLVNYVRETLQNRHNKSIILNKFTLDLVFISEPEFSSLIEHCFRYAIGCHVKELWIRSPTRCHPRYVIPQMILCAQSINALKLDGCKLESPGSAKLSSMRQLSLHNVFADDEVIENILAGCPLIEDISIEGCEGFKSLKLFDHGQLNKINIRDNKELVWVVVKAFSVRAVHISGRSIPREINLYSCRNLQTLCLDMAPIKDEWLCDRISKFPLLEYLAIALCGELSCIKISTSSLKRLKIWSCEKLVEVKLDTPNLKTFDYIGDIVSFSLDGLALLETDLCFYSKNIDTQWYVKYVEHIKKFHRISKVLTLTSKSGDCKNLIFPEDLRQTVLPPCPDIKHLNSGIYYRAKYVAIKDAVDGLLWVSPHPKTVSIKSDDFSFEFQFSYKKEITYEGEFAECCKCRPVSCWRLCIKDVKIKYTYKRREVKKYTFKGEEIWKKMDCLLKLQTA